MEKSEMVVVDYCDSKKSIFACLRKHRKVMVENFTILELTGSSPSVALWNLP